MSGLVCLWHTARWLRWPQVVFRARRWLPFPKPDRSPPPPVRTAVTRWILGPRALRWRIDRGFSFHGDCYLVRRPSDWSPRSAPKLALYQMHYFEDLSASAAVGQEGLYRSMMEQWLADNAPGSGVGWEPYPLSMRIVNCTKWLWSEHWQDFPALLHSLAVQARWLSGRLEHHLLGNHLWANAKALVFAGSLFDGGEAAFWRARGLRLLRRELAEQLLLDGGHFERTPMYHGLFTEDLLDLVQLARVVPGVVPENDVAAWRAALPGMLRWAAALSHPDGSYAHFNDVAQGIALTAAQLASYARTLDVGVDVGPGRALLANSGYARLQCGPAVLLADVAPIGPDYIPGHAHADTLSFELSVAGHRLFVNSGTSTYARNEDRARERGTKAHNTVIVDDQDSSEVWASFRVARRARVLGVTWQADSGEQRLEAAHDGYRRLPGRITHRRAWTLRSDSLVIDDTLDGRLVSAEARFHVAPGWTARVQDGLVILSGQGGIVKMEGRQASFHVEAGRYARTFGAVVPIQVVVARLVVGSSRLTLRWEIKD